MSRREQLSWQGFGACRNVADPEVFFPVGDDAEARWKTREAKKVCFSCPVRAACLSWALEAREPDGIWGGLTVEERLVALEEIRKAREADTEVDVAAAVPGVGVAA